MADLRFSVPNADDFDPRVWETAYITGIEGIPWHCHHTLKGQQFSIGREIDESGKLNLVWPSGSLGNVCLSSTSLRLREDAYSLPVEMARGTVFRLKTQTEEWQRVGLRLADEFYSLAEESLAALLSGLTSKFDVEKQIADSRRSIDLALQASIDLCEAFSLQALEARRNNEGRLATLLGCQLHRDASLDDVGDALRTAFNLVSVPADFGSVEPLSGGQNYSAFDHQIEWVSSSDQKVCVGPLVDFRDGRLPEWMILLDEGFDAVLQSACRFAQQTVERYRGRTHLWNCAAGLNAPNQFGWSDEEILRMAVSLIETVRRTDDRSPVLLTIDQPWSEYLRDDASGISPLHFADALIRADLGLSGLALELNFDKWPGGTFPRDPIEINRLIDRWSMLGLPLMIILSSPTNEASPETANGVSGWNMPTAQGHISPDTIVRLLLSKPSVHAIIWNSLSDALPGYTAGCGLWNNNGKAKSLLAHMAKLRKSCLN